MSAIEVENVGRIDKLKIAVPPGGGVVVLQGENGLGKTIALQAIDEAVSGRKSTALTPRDGTGRGTVNAFGAKLTIQKKATRNAAELSVTTLEGRFDVGMLVDPGIKDVDRADASRIKALLNLAGVQPDLSLFNELFGSPEELQRTIASDTRDADDINVMAAKLKRDIEEQARRAEGQALAEASHAKVARESVEGVDITQRHDERLLNEEYERSIRALESLKTRKNQADSYETQKNALQSQLDAAKPQPGQLTIEDYRNRNAFCGNRKADAQEEVEKARLALSSAEFALKLATQAQERAQSDLQEAESHAVRLQKIEDALKSLGEAIEPPTVADISHAEQLLLEAREAVNVGVRVRDAIARKAKAEQHENACAAITATAERWRKAAADVDRVLSEQIAKLNCPLKVDNGRLVIATPRGPLTKYSELSDGERWRVAIDVAAECLDSTGLLVLPQVAWEALAPKARQAIDAHAQARGVTILTAECSADETIVVKTFAEGEG